MVGGLIQTEIANLYLDIPILFSVCEKWIHVTVSSLHIQCTKMKPSNCMDITDR